MAPEMRSIPGSISETSIIIKTIQRKLSSLSLRPDGLYHKKTVCWFILFFSEPYEKKEPLHLSPPLQLPTCQEHCKTKER